MPKLFFKMFRRRLARADLGQEKGLENPIGQNNCFLNVVIQGLWHLVAFRKNFEACSYHSHPQDPYSSCIFCALKLIFEQYSSADRDVLPPTALRQALSDLFAAQDRFQLGELDDAAEALEAVLGSIHDAVRLPGPAGAVDDPDACQPACFIHRIFGINIVEQLRCTACGDDSEPTTLGMLMTYCYTADLVRSAASHPRGRDFDFLLGDIARDDTRPCSSANCQNQCIVRRFLLDLPQVFTVGLVWATAEPTREEIVPVLTLVSEQIDLSYIFDIPAECQSRSRYRLRGMVCYYGKHYDAYFYDDAKRVWWVFDDATVHQVRPLPRSAIQQQFHTLTMLRACPSSALVLVTNQQRGGVVVLTLRCDV
eukprot:TRINITY_DN15304_c0_g1_i1.p1 TRINITY_DN15304_c0_g1~~TRINITY_DN15304_c0_g1_i1.p1  ORF type:complete len:367 (-),score=73.39 TRINITY_DN15304_c0_g1_i1:227-1327(-)